MKKIYSESELKDLAGKTFEKFTNAQKVYATGDGNIFLDKNRAEIHVGQQGQVLEIQRPISKETVLDKTKQPSVNEVISQIEITQTVEGLKEFENDTRATVVKALEKKAKELAEADLKEIDVTTNTAE